MTFQKTVLIIALVLLILSLVIVGVLIKSAATTAKFPPEVSTCPDYFKVQNQNGTIHCTNPLSLGSCPTGLTPIIGNDMDSRVANCKKSRGCGVTWDGLTSATANQGNPYC
jgi:hypothetical protein